MNGRKYPREFERITKNGDLRRIQVPGGWIVNSSAEHIYHGSSGSCSEGLVFIEDKDYSWVLEQD